MTITEMINKVLDSASLVALGVFLIPLIGYLFGGLRRGIGRQIVHAATMCLSAVASFFLTRAVWGKFFSIFEGHSLGEYVDMANSKGANIPENLRAIIDALDPITAEYILALPMGLLIIPLIFALIFWVMNLVLRIVYFVLSRILVPLKGGPVSRALGAVLGVLEGAVIMTLLMLPVNAVYNLGVTTASTLAPEEEISAVPMLELTNKLGSEKLLTSFTTLKVGEEKIDLKDEYVKVLSAYKRNEGALSDMDLINPAPDDKAAVDDIISTLTESPYLSTIITGTLRSAANLVDSGAIPIEVDDTYSDLLNSSLVIFREASASHLREDLDTIKTVYYILASDGVLTAMKDGGDIIASLAAKDENGKTVVNHLVDAINSNPRTARLITVLVKLSITVLSENMELGDDAAVIYDEIKNEVNVIIGMSPDDYATHGEYVDAVSDELDDALKAHGITVERYILDDMAAHIGEELQGKEELTDEEFNELLLTYFDSYASYIENGAPGSDGDNAGEGGSDELGGGEDNIDGDGWTG